MQIEVKGRGTAVSEELREYVEKRFRRIAAQVSELATLEVEVREERNPAIPEHCVVEATLKVKGTRLRASDRGRDARQAINLVEDELARQVKRHRDKRRNHRKVGTASIRTMPASTAMLPPTGTEGPQPTA
jgi:putative sigma-54 modulation protein